VYHDVRRRCDGSGERIHPTVRERVRRRVGGTPKPRAGSASMATTPACAGEERGDDGATKRTGQKRYLLVATHGWGWQANAHWVRGSRRLRKDEERRRATGEARSALVMGRLTRHRLARA
ncbi:MAG TPA: hypothetical protein VFA70_01930, partial [Dehalococcoidia bacterium]|nr:hypothetical protein [Dehalococcoidia bacterium]